ncbi:hypothetical protein CcaCcLH18_13856 [Colletotrichum camelliae]|nr:hypothetical protein CcaCcLH18_13856 [Colletotrichum camelliae]
MDAVNISTKRGPTIAALPNEILHIISSFLPSKDHLSLMLVSHQIHSILGDRVVVNAVARGQRFAFAWACKTGRLDVMGRCMDLGMKPNLCAYTSEPDFDHGVYYKRKLPYRPKYLPMIGLSMLSGQLDAVRLLISRGATLDDLPPWPHLGSVRNPLYYARHVPMFRFVLEDKTRRRAIFDDADTKFNCGDLLEVLMDEDAPDEALIFVVESCLECKDGTPWISTPPIYIPWFARNAAKQGRLGFIEKLFKAVPELTSYHHPLWFIYAALQPCSSSSWSCSVQSMLETLNSAASILPTKDDKAGDVGKIVSEVLSEAWHQEDVSAYSLDWLLNNGLVTSDKGRRALHEWFKYDCTLVGWVGSPKDRKRAILLRYDRSLALYLLQDSIAYFDILDILESLLIDGRLAPYIALHPGELLRKILTSDNLEGTLHRTARIVETLVALGATEPPYDVLYNPATISWCHVIVFVCKIKLDPHGGQYLGIPDSTVYDMSGDEEITTCSQYLAQRRISILRMARVLLATTNMDKFFRENYYGRSVKYVKCSGIYNDLPELQAAVQKHEALERDL